MMGTGSLVLFFCIAAAVIVTGILASFSMSRQDNAAFRKVADRLGAWFREGSLFDEPEFRFVLSGCPAWLLVSRGDRSTPPFIRVAVNVRNRVAVRPRIKPVALLRELEKRFQSPTIDLDEHYLVVQVLQYDADEEMLMDLVRSAGTVLEFFLNAAPVPGILLGEVRVTADGECQVCGAGMVDEVIRCESCRTPHHRECWQYVGRCTTYGCRGRRFIA